jgi:hypothetical protein
MDRRNKIESSEIFIIKKFELFIYDFINSCRTFLNYIRSSTIYFESVIECIY